MKNKRLLTIIAALLFSIVSGVCVGWGSAIKTIGVAGAMAFVILLCSLKFDLLRPEKGSRGFTTLCSVVSAFYFSYYVFSLNQFSAVLNWIVFAVLFCGSAVGFGMLFCVCFNALMKSNALGEFSGINSQKTLKSSFCTLCRDLRYILPVVLTSVLTFGYFVTHFAINIDDLSGDRYYFGESIAQGRVTGTVFMRLFGFDESAPWVSEMLSVIFLTLSVIVTACIFDIIVKKVNIWVLTVFSCLFISAPIFVECMPYYGCSEAVGLGMLFVALAVYLVFDFSRTGGARKCFSAIVLLILFASWYESVIAFYVALVFAVILLQLLSNDKSMRFFTMLKNGVLFAIPLVTAIVLETIFSNALILVLGIEKSHNVKNGIQWFSGDIKEVIGCFKRDFSLNYRNVALDYLPITLLFAAIGLLVVLAIIDLVKTKNICTPLLYAGVAASSFMLSIIQGIVSEYRMQQVFAFICAFAVFVLLLKLSVLKVKQMYAAALLLSAVLLVNQVRFSSNMYVYDYQRSQAEIKTVEDIAYKLESSFDTTKPVTFVGYYQQSERVRSKLDRRSSMVFNSYISWGISAFDEKNTELLKLFNYCGHNFLQADESIYFEADEYVKANDTPAWPKNGSIVDMGEYIVVNVGEVD